MLLRFEGDKVFPLAPMAVWDKLSDPRFLLTCLPGLEPGAQADETSARWVVRPGLSFVRGTLEVTLQRLEAEPERLVRYQLHGKGIGSSNTVVAALEFTPHETGTQVQWIMEITELGGLLKAVPQGLIKASAQKVINDIWAIIDTRMDETAP